MYSIRIPYLEIPRIYYLLILIRCQIKYYAEIKHFHMISSFERRAIGLVKYFLLYLIYI